MPWVERNIIEDAGKDIWGNRRYVKLYTAWDVDVQTVVNSPSTVARGYVPTGSTVSSSETLPVPGAIIWEESNQAQLQLESYSCSQSGTEITIRALYTTSVSDINLNVSVQNDRVTIPWAYRLSTGQSAGGAGGSAKTWQYTSYNVEVPKSRLVLSARVHFAYTDQVLTNVRESVNKVYKFSIAKVNNASGPKQLWKFEGCDLENYGPLTLNVKLMFQSDPGIRAITFEPNGIDPADYAFPTGVTNSPGGQWDGYVLPPFHNIQIVSGGLDTDQRNPPRPKFIRTCPYDFVRGTGSSSTAAAEEATFPPILEKFTLPLAFSTNRNSGGGPLATFPIPPQ